MYKIILISLTILKLITSTCGDYWTDRSEFIKLEESQMVGASIILNNQEKILNDFIMVHKSMEYDQGFENSSVFSPHRHFFQAKEAIEKSVLFQIIKKMPKGAALHGHDVSMTSHEYLYNLTFRDNLYGCKQNGRLRLMFLETPTQDETCNWTLVSVLRNRDSTFDGWLKSQLTLLVKDPRKAYQSINSVWKTFLDIFSTVFQMVTYKPVFKDLLYQTLKELEEDNVMYLEFRGILPPVYELNGTIYQPHEVAEIYHETIQQFQKDHPKFIGARFIYGPLRNATDQTFQTYVQTSKYLKQYYPDMFAGFDLVGQEDLGRPQSAFIEELLEMKAAGIDFFFHAGETNWFGTTSDNDLIDAILLGTKRIGHGYALIKHPRAMKLVKEKQIAVEICPISNQVLMLVNDLRNHPANTLISQGFPIVISYDDPSFWGSKGLSYDFYLAFMGLASKNADLKLLKQLAINSISYSSMPQEEKDRALRNWETDWMVFVEAVISENIKKQSYTGSTETNEV